MQFIEQILAYSMLGVGAIGLIYLGGKRVLTGVKLPTFASGVDDDTLDFQALSRLQHRFERLQCKEGTDACTTALTHFFHGHPGQQ